MPKPIWNPSAERIGTLSMNRFVRKVGPRLTGKNCDYEEVHKASVRDPGRFWAELWTFSGVIGDMGSPPYLTDAGQMPGARFFPTATLNFAENALANGDPDRDALICWGEDKVKRRLTWSELTDAVGKLQAALTETGVDIGDRVAAVLPNMPESIIGALAAAASGAVWASCSPDFGTQALLDRFSQIGPKVLIIVDGYRYNGKLIDNCEKITALVEQLPTVVSVIVVSNIGLAADLVMREAGSGDRRFQLWSDAVSDRRSTTPRYVPLPFNHPLYILFSSGTTGVPKCIVHSAGGVLLKHICEQQLHSDIRPGDRLFYFTTLGWMMWNWLVSGLVSGATLLLYDGSPFHPSGEILWQFAEQERCTHFGTSAKYLDALNKNGLRPGQTHNLTNLRAIFSTGSPLSPESFDYVYQNIKNDLHLASISGGTDICGCFVLGNPLKPVYRGEIQGAALGLDVDVVSEHGAHLHGGKGELVCRNPFPSMPIGFLADPGDRNYTKAYFARFPNLWHQGDFAEWTETGGIIIHGRSDTTLNPGGVRIGTAEIYRQVEKLPEVRESVVVGQDLDGDVRVILFVVVQPQVKLDEELRAKIRTQIREGTSPRHIPAKILEVEDIPKTKSGKISEIAVREMVMRRPIPNKDALDNPECLELFRNIEELQT